MAQYYERIYLNTATAREEGTTIKPGNKSNPLDVEGLCLLSLDGGGVRGLSTLYILKTIMDQLNSKRKHAGLGGVKPCEVFDLIGGTSTGGLIAIMLGRLEMDVDQCIAAYSDLAAAVFGERLSSVPFGLKGNVKSRFDSTKLESAVRKVIKDGGISEDDYFNDDKERGCRTFVCAADRFTKGTVRLRSYSLPEESGVHAKICQAALATSAATTFFDPVSIGSRSFADGGLGANNPVDEVEGEASNIWCTETGDLKPLVKCFVSIGTGNPGIQPYEQSMLGFMRKTLVDIATETENTEKKFVARWAKHLVDKRYFRFNVAQGLQGIGLDEYKKRGEMEAATEYYLTHTEQKVRVRECIANLSLKQRKTETSFVTKLTEYTNRTIRQYPVPANNEAASGTQTPSSCRCVSVPYHVVSTYTERAVLSHELEEKLARACGGGGLSHAVTVAGLGGMGKTQLVMHYVNVHMQDYETVLWLDARSEETTRSSFERCCRALSLPFQTSTGQNAVDEAPAVQTVLHWLRARSSEQKWLVVVDNADDLSWNVSRIVPQGPAGSVIVTSQDSTSSRIVGGRSNVIRVDVMTTREAVSLLYNCISERVDLQDEEMQHLAERVVARLDNLPLAIDLAGARIRADVEDGDEVKVSLRRYLTDLERHQDILLQNKEYAGSTLYGKTVWTVWETSMSSLRRLEAEDAGPQPLQLLQLLVTLDRTNIQEELLRLASRRLDEACQQLCIRVPYWLREMLSVGEDGAWDDFHYRAAVRWLLRYSLVRPATGRWPGLTMHSLVQWRARREGEGGAQQEWFLTVIVAACMQQLVKADVQFRRYMVVHLPQNRTLIASGPNGAQEHLAWAWMIIGRIWYAEGRYKLSEELFEMAWKEWARTLGEEHPNTLSAIGSLASTYWNQGRWKEAEELEVKVVEARERTQGDEHPDTLSAIGSLASTYRNQGRWKEAEELEVKIVEARERTLGEEHPNTLSAIGNLASTYWKQGRWKEAEKLEVKVVEAIERTLGEEHPNTLSARGSLASTYRNQGRWKEAEELEVKVVEARERTLGEEHPDTLLAIGNLASTYWNQGRWKEAEELNVKVVEARERTLGEEHPDTLSAIGNLASTYWNQGRWKEAEELEVKVVEARERTLGEEHPDTLRARGSLASTYWNQGRWKEAEELEVKVVEAMERTLGDEHPNTLSARGSLASTYRNQGRWKEAAELEVKVVEARERTQGDEHPKTLSARGSLASTYRNQGRWKEAEELEVKVVEAMKRTLGEEHPDTLSAIGSLASTYWNQGRWKEAEELEVKIVEARERTQGDEHPDTLRARANLAATYWSQERWKEAEELLAKVAIDRRRVLGAAHPNTVASESNLSEMRRRIDVSENRL